MSNNVHSPKIVRLSPPSIPLRGSVSLPGSKSFTNRALVAASLAPGKSVLVGASAGEDTELLRNALSRLGVSTSRHDAELRVHGRNRLAPYQGEVFLGLAGTTLRFLLPLCAGTGGVDVTLSGTPRLHERPIGDLVDALRQLGADIRYLGTEGCPPLRVRGRHGLRGGTLAVRGDVSSQFTSALLLAAPLYDEALRLEIMGPRSSTPYVDMTLQTMRSFGIGIDAASGAYEIPEAGYRRTRYTIEGDATGASYFWGLAAIAPGTVATENLPPDSIQGDLEFLGILERMGCRVTRRWTGGAKSREDFIEVQGPPPGALRSVTADMSRMPDSALTLAVVASVAKGVSRLYGLATLKYKETDRLRALQRELGRLGIESHASDDALEVVGGVPRGALTETYGDHRIAMAFATLGARVENLRVRAPEVVTKSFPGYWAELARLGLGVTVE